MRLFYALSLPESLKADLAAFQLRARKAAASASWPDPRNLHLTLAFLGEQDASRLPALMRVAASAAAGHARFVLRTSLLGGFPRERSARVLWLGLDAQPSLMALAGDLRRELREAGVAFDEKPFQAHLTLARFRTPQEVGRFGEPPAPMAFMVQEVTLFQSVPSAGGVRHVPLGTAPLAGNDAG